MNNINGIPSTASPGVQGEIRNPMPNVNRIEFETEGSILAYRAATIQFDYEDLQRKSQAAHHGVSETAAALGEAKGRLARMFPQGVDWDVYKQTASEAVLQEIEAAERNVVHAENAHNHARAISKDTTKAMSIAGALLKETPRQIAADSTRVEPKPLPRGETAQGVIDRIDAEIAKVKAAVRPQDEIVAEAMADIDRQAALALPRVSGGKRVSVSFPVVGISAEPSGQELPHCPTPVPWLARFHRDELEADIKAQIAQKYAGVTLTLSERDKARKLMELAAERLNADRIRCEAIWKAHEMNPTANLVFPKDADVRAALGIIGAEPRRYD